jgi:hypothetical protein
VLLRGSWLQSSRGSMERSQQMTHRESPFVRARPGEARPHTPSPWLTPTGPPPPQLGQLGEVTLGPVQRRRSQTRSSKASTDYCPASPASGCWHRLGTRACAWTTEHEYVSGHLRNRVRFPAWRRATPSPNSPTATAYPSRALASPPSLTPTTSGGCPRRTGSFVPRRGARGGTLSR